MKAWLDLHGRAKVLATDHWYLEFANLLLPVVSESYLYKSETQESQNQVTLMLTLYLEDCVTDGGNWRQFIRWHKRNYGRYLPFYELSEGYHTDEINKEDIAFLLWGINSPVGDDFDGVENPLFHYYSVACFSFSTPYYLLPITYSTVFSKPVLLLSPREHPVLPSR